MNAVLSLRVSSSLLATYVDIISASDDGWGLTYDTFRLNADVIAASRLKERRQNEENRSSR
jgi:hypothetical protein